MTFPWLLLNLLLEIFPNSNVTELNAKCVASKIVLLIVSRGRGGGGVS